MPWCIKFQTSIEISTQEDTPMQTRNVIGNLIKRYKAVLKKCNILNNIGSLILASGLLLCPMLVDVANAKTNDTTITSNGFVASPGDSTLINNGDILGGYFFENFSPNDSVAGMYGSHTSGSIDYIFTNTGNINISYINPITNGDTTVYARVYAYGMHADGEGSHTLTNSGDIIITAQGGIANAQASNANVEAYASAYAYGMSAYGEGNHNLTNSRDITVNAQGETANAQSRGNHNAYANARAYAYGMSAYGEGNHNLTNSGDINVTAQGGTATAHSERDLVEENAYAGAYAYGMSIFGNGSHRLTNLGHITVTAKGGAATGGDSSVAHGFAYGMHVKVVDYEGEHIVNNYGIINATATEGTSDSVITRVSSHAFEVYGDDSYIVETFATTLQPWIVIPDVRNGIADTVFGIYYYEQINFKDTSLILRPQVTAQGVELGKLYNVSDMIAVADSSHSVGGNIGRPAAENVTGTIAEAVTEVPFLTATLTDGANPLSATVRIDANVNEDTVPGAIPTVQNITLVQGQMSNIARHLLQTYYNAIYAELTSETGSASGSSIEEENKWTAFLTPYFNLTDNSKYNFDGHSTGVIGGINYHVNDSFSFGMHLDFNHSNYDADIMDMENSSTSFALGVHAHYNIMPEWYVSAQVTGAFTQTSNDYSSYTNPYLYADTDYNSKSLYLALNSGYVFKFSDNFSIMPEIGLSYLTMHTDAYDINWHIAGAHIPAYDIDYNDNSYSNLFGNVNINAKGEWDLTENSGIALNVGVGVRQSLTADDIESKFRTLGNRYTASATSDNTTFLADIGLGYNFGHVYISLKYNGEYGDNQVMHGGNLNLSFDF